jgi:hypothetical protein
LHFLKLNYENPIIKSGLETVWWLRKINHERRREYPHHIQAVFVLSGPGTYYQRLKAGQDEKLRWMDRDRIRAGVAVMSELTLSTMRKLGLADRGKLNIYRKEISAYGPLFIYNGQPVENSDFLKAVYSRFSKLPAENVFLIHEVQRADGSIRPIEHTGDQVRSLFQHLEGDLSSIRRIAVVQHESDFGRTLHYFKKYNDEREAKGLTRIDIWPYAVKNRKGTFYPLLKSELERLIPYFLKGDLAYSAEIFSKFD